jgi:hypothetical protein
MLLAVVNSYTGVKLADAEKRWYVLVTLAVLVWATVFTAFGLFLKKRFPAKEVDEAPVELREHWDRAGHGVDVHQDVHEHRTSVH